MVEQEINVRDLFRFMNNHTEEFFIRVDFTQEGDMILLNKTTLRSKRFIRKKDCLSLFSINPLNANSFLGVARRNHIIYYSFSYDHI